MTRRQCGSLLLHCMKLSFTTPCRLLPAHLNGLNILNYLNEKRPFIPGVQPVPNVQKIPAITNRPLRCRHLFGLFDGLVDGADHVKSLFRNIVVLAVDDFFESADRVFQFHVRAGSSGERLGDMKRLR
jgi:hypothetical protein